VDDLDPVHGPDVDRYLVILVRVVEKLVRTLPVCEIEELG